MLPPGGAAQRNQPSLLARTVRPAKAATKISAPQVTNDFKALKLKDAVRRWQQKSSKEEGELRAGTNPSSAAATPPEAQQPTDDSRRKNKASATRPPAGQTMDNSHFVAEIGAASLATAVYAAAADLGHPRPVDFTGPLSFEEIMRLKEQRKSQAGGETSPLPVSRVNRIPEIQKAQPHKEAIDDKPPNEELAETQSSASQPADLIHQLTVEDEKLTVEDEKLTVEDEKLTVEELTMEDEKLTMEDEKVTVEPEKITVEDEKITVEDEKVTVVTPRQEPETPMVEAIVLKQPSVAAAAEPFSPADTSHFVPSQYQAIALEPPILAVAPQSLGHSTPAGTLSTPLNATSYQSKTVPTAASELNVSPTTLPVVALAAVQSTVSSNHQPPLAQPKIKPPAIQPKITPPSIQPKLSPPLAQLKMASKVANQSADGNLPMEMDAATQVRRQQVQKVVPTGTPQVKPVVAPQVKPVVAPQVKPVVAPQVKAVVAPQVKAVIAPQVKPVVGKSKPGSVSTPTATPIKAVMRPVTAKRPSQSPLTPGGVPLMEMEKYAAWLRGCLSAAELTQIESEVESICSPLFTPDTMTGDQLRTAIEGMIARLKSHKLGARIVGDT